MCGIYGLFQLTKSGLFESDIDTLKAMAIVTSLRGDHSSGIAVLRNKPTNRPWTAKSVGDPFNLFHNADIIKQLKTSTAGQHASLGVFGHGRLATRGDITPRNAHPFTEGNITLVHNGTLMGGVDMEGKCDKGEKVDVDSHALAIEMSKVGVAEALKNVYGAYAIIAHDKDAGKVYFATNGERPLSYIRVQGKLWVMSEAEALYYVVDKKCTSSVKAADIYPFDKNTLYTLDLTTFEFTKGESLVKPVTPSPFRKSSGRGTATSTNTIFECTSVRKDPLNDKQWEYTFIDVDNLVYHAYSSNHQPDRVGQVAECAVYRLERDGTLERRTLKFKHLNWYETPGQKKEEEDLTGEVVKTVTGKYVLKRDFKKAIKNGCQLCQGAMYENEAEVSIYLDDGGVVCQQCVTDGTAAKFSLIRTH